MVMRPKGQSQMTVASVPKVKSVKEGRDDAVVKCSFVSQGEFTVYGAMRHAFAVLLLSDGKRG